MPVWQRLRMESQRGGMGIEAQLPLMQRLWIYQGERFPLQRHGPLIAMFCGASALYGARLKGMVPSVLELAGAIVCAGAFFLLMRIADEFKDRHDDQRWRPYRPVPRGLVRLAELNRVAWATALVQGLLVLWLAPAAWWLLALTWGWFALMGVEFFVPRWLRARPLLYTLSHMVIVPLIALLAIGFVLLPAGDPLPGPPLLPLLALCYCNGLVIEFARKIRRPSHEEPGVDTWSAHWGLRPALLRWLGVVLVSIPLAMAAARAIGALPWVVVLLLPLMVWILMVFRPEWRAAAREDLPVGARGEGRSGARPALRSGSPEPLELPTALWTLATYLALGWLPALLGSA